MFTFHVFFSMSLTVSQSWVRFWLIYLEYSFSKKIYNKQNICMLNMLTFIVFSVCHSLGQSLRGIALPSQYFELYHRNIAFPRNFLIKYVLFVLFFSHKFYLYRFVLNFVFVAVVFVYLTIFFIKKETFLLLSCLHVFCI